MSISCKEVTRLVSEGLDRHLSLAERTQLKLHFAICRGCRAVNEQMQFLRRAMRQLFEPKD
jgi:putative zinc finger protein